MHRFNNKRSVGMRNIFIEMSVLITQILFWTLNYYIFIKSDINGIFLTLLILTIYVFASGITLGRLARIKDRNKN